MSHLIQVATGYRGVSLPNGLVLMAGQTALLSDTDWAALSGSPLIGTVLIDQGAFTAGTVEVQTITITGAPTSGTFTLTANAVTTAAIAFNATAAAVQAALNGLAGFAPATVTGAGPYVVTFNEVGDVTQITASGAGLLGGTTPAVVVVTTIPGVGTNYNLLFNRALAALTTNATYLAIGPAPTAAQETAEVIAHTKQIDGLVHLILGLNTSITGT